MASSTVEAGHPNVVSHTKWLAARKEFLIKEKEFTHLREEMSRLRRALPWEKVERRYEFDARVTHSPVKLRMTEDYGQRA
jgi:predicted dithiol-disulfide oxidoreductase (DUF899 family)